MDLRKLKTILELFEDSNVAELEISEGDSRVRLNKYTTAAPSTAAAPAAPAASGGGNGNGNGAPAAPMPAASAAEGGEAAVSGQVVPSPMVGTFYRSSTPGAKPFVRVGQTVEQGQTLCIIEAMKLMNEIPSPVAGVVKKILVENGSPVGYGDALFEVE